MGTKVKPITLAMLMFSFYACGNNDENPTRPVTPTPIPTPTPVVVTPIVPTPNPIVFELIGGPGACLTIRYNGEATYAEVETSARALDSRTNYGYEIKTIPTGEQFTRCFGIGCIEIDAEQVNVKPIGGIWFDRNMNPASAQKAVDSCSKTPTTIPTPTPSSSPKPTPTPTPSPTPCPHFSWKKCK